jgi:hypothetical protein
MVEAENNLIALRSIDRDHQHYIPARVRNADLEAVLLPWHVST